MTPEELAQDAMTKHPDQVAADIQAVFSHPRADTLLAWLMDTCCATETTIDESAILMAAAEGRRQVWVALNKILSLNARDIAALRRRVAAWEADTSE